VKSKAAVLLIIAAMAAAVFLSGNKELPPLSDMTVFRNLSRGDVIFPHEQHHRWGISCFHCHHRSVKGGDLISYEELVPGAPAVSCIACHGTGRELERMHHRMCIDCHRDLAGKNVKAGPVTCGRCHKKKGR